MLHADALAAPKSQVNGLNCPSRHHRAKMKQRTSLTSHNAKNCRSEPISY
jgi:hypothetical protein